ncbi:transposase B regulatory protein [Mammaliicoccus lentus]|uniref:site-specific integrase n=2 Tax=Bacteria TaxID=2 RepID=UPI00085CCDE2|nr:site-specific integrase [Mammaliicoccus lentus]SCT99796.1 transposase B regulatory protein [Mammaliicoccus lentus]
MVNTDSHLALFDYDPSEPEVDFRCGKNKFSDMEWDFNGYVDSPHLSGARLKIRFDKFAHKPDILEVVKWYVHHQLITNKFSTAKRNYDGITLFIKFVDECLPELDSFYEITSEILIIYFEYLMDSKSETTKKPLSKVSIKKGALTLKDILIKGATKGWDVPDDVSYVQRIYNDMIIHNKKLKSNSKEIDDKHKGKISDEKLIDLIVKTAVQDLEQDKNILVASAIIITFQLGLRINEIITLESGCLVQIDGDMMIDTSTTKLHAERIEILKPANELVILAVTKLEEYSKPLRAEAKMPYLFLNRQRNKKGWPAKLVSHSNWNKNFVRPWLTEHNLFDENGKLVDFTSHTFRHAFATYALKGGASIEVISELMNHKSIRGTKYYTHLLQEDIKNRFAEVLNEGAIISGKKALQIKDKLKELQPFKGKTVEQVDKLRKAMKIQVLSHGLCTHHPMRNEPCIGDGVCLGCSNFITTPEFLDVHKSRLENVQRELAKAPKEGPFESKLKHMEKYLIEIIDDLENQMNYKGESDNTQYKVIN